MQPPASERETRHPVRPEFVEGIRSNLTRCQEPFDRLVWFLPALQVGCGAGVKGHRQASGQSNDTDTAETSLIHTASVDEESSDELGSIADVCKLTQGVFTPTGVIL